MIAISEPAVMFEDGALVLGSSHNRIHEAVFGSEHMYLRYREGFVTTEGKFVSRFKAATIAHLAGQIPNGLERPEEGLHSGDVAGYKLRADEIMEEGPLVFY